MDEQYRSFIQNQHELFVAYKAGRKIIAEETMDRLNQYINHLSSSESHAREQVERLRDMAQKTVQLVVATNDEALRREKGAKIEGYLTELHKEVDTEHVALKKVINTMTAYLKTMDSICKVEEWESPTLIKHVVYDVACYIEPKLQAAGAQLEVSYLQQPQGRVLSRPRLTRILRGLAKRVLHDFEQAPPDAERLLRLSMVQVGAGVVQVRFWQRARVFSQKACETMWLVGGKDDAVFSMYFFNVSAPLIKGKLWTESSREAGTTYVLELSDITELSLP